MSIKQQICKALCSGFDVREVPVGLAISSPYNWLTGEKITFYARTRGALVRFEDSGSTIFDLENAGVDLTTSARLEILEGLKTEFGVDYDEDEVIFHTEWVDAPRVGLKAISFLGFLQRVQDLTFTTRERVASTFREDLICALKERFKETATVEVDEAPAPKLEYYKVDIVIKHRNGKMAAIFPATSEQKTLEAILFAKEIELKQLDDIVPFLVYENALSSKISKSTHAKACNSELTLAAWEGGALDVLDKVERHIQSA